MPETVANETPAATAPVVRRIGMADLRDAFAKGIDDFRHKPTHLVFVGLFYPIMMLLLARIAFGEGLLPLIFPIVSGGALLGPFVAIGLYELSRRREQGLSVHWTNVFDVRNSAGLGAILRVGLVLAILFLLWLAAAQAIYSATLAPLGPETVSAFVDSLFTTRAGLTLIIAGNAVGFLFAVAALAVSVVSFPLILDRHVGALTAMGVSIRAVATNPIPMAAWGFMVALLLLAGALPVFIGLIVIMPILGHATWHLYRKVVG